MSSCRHGSNGFMGAIQENNIHLVRQFLSRIDCTLMHSLFTHETKFGDTLLTLAAALGRTAIVDVLIKAIPSLDQVDNRTQALSDVLDYETSRGKTPIIEAAKCNHADVVDILLRHHADPKRASKIHRKSALDWATTLGHANITRTIRDHVQLKELSLSLFVAVSKSDLPTIESLTAGGVPYLPNQDAKFMHALESKLHQVDLANQNLNGLSQAHQGCDAEKIHVETEMKARAERLETMQATQNEIVSNNQRDAMMAKTTERELLERNKVDSRVLTSGCAILQREIDNVLASIQNNSNHVLQLRRKLEVGRLMKFVTGGYSILSWAAATGNVEVIKILLKRGAHTGIGDDCMEWCATIIQVAYRNHQSRKQRHDLKWVLDFTEMLRIRNLSNLIHERLKGLRLPLAEALFNGHSKVASLLDQSDVPNSQALNLFHLFRKPQGTMPKSRISYDRTILLWKQQHCLPSGGIGELISSVIVAAQTYSHEDDPRCCAYNESFQVVMDLATTCLQQRREIMEGKIATRKETLRKEHRNAMAAQLSSAILHGDFITMVQSSTEGDISLDYEDDHTGMTPLIRAAMENNDSMCINDNGERVTAVAYLVDRISPFRPSIDYENRYGYTALGMASMHGCLGAMVDLIDRGANVDRRAILDGRTPWMLAHSSGKVEAMKLLAKHSGVEEFEDEVGGT